MKILRPAWYPLLALLLVLVTSPASAGLQFQMYLAVDPGPAWAVGGMSEGAKDGLDYQDVVGQEQEGCNMLFYKTPEVDGWDSEAATLAYDYRSSSHAQRWVCKLYQPSDYGARWSFLLHYYSDIPYRLRMEAVSLDGTTQFDSGYFPDEFSGFVDLGGADGYMLTIYADPVPEPASQTSLLIFLAGLSLSLRRSRRMRPV